MQFYDRNWTIMEEDMSIWFQEKHTKDETWKHFLPKYPAYKIIGLIDSMERDGILRYTRKDQMFALSLEAVPEMDVGV